MFVVLLWSLLPVAVVVTAVLAVSIVTVVAVVACGYAAAVATGAAHLKISARLIPKTTGR